MKKILKRVNNLWWNIVVFFCSFFCKRDENVVLIGAWMGTKFADNPRFLFQYLAENKKRLGLKQVVWCTRSSIVCKELLDMGYKCVLIGTRESFYWHCKAGIHIICNAMSNWGDYLADIDSRLSIGAKKIQLWHGNGIKKVNGWKQDSFFELPLFYWPQLITSSGGWYRGNYYCLCKSQLDVELFYQKLGTSEKKCIYAAYPRTCPCVQYLLSEKHALDKIGQYKKTILYLPTFRDSEDYYKHPFENVELLSFLEKNDYLWIEKKHFVDASKNELSKIDVVNNILFLESTFDINVLNPVVDLLITDYSSAMLDALFFEKQIIYYTPDFEYYKNKDRGFYMDYDSITIRPKVADPSDLMDEIIQALKTEKYDEKALELKKLFWGTENLSYEKIWAAIIQKK